MKFGAFFLIPAFLLSQGCGMMFTYLAPPDDSPKTIEETKALYEPVETGLVEAYNKVRSISDAGISDSGQMRLALDYSMDCEKMGAYLASGPAADDAQWRHLPKPVYNAHPEFNWGDFKHLWSGTVPEEMPLFPNDHELQTDFGAKQLGEVQRYCRQQNEKAAKAKVPGCYLHTAEALVPWLGTGVFGKAMIRIPSWSCDAKKEKAHDLSKQLSDNPLACAEMPQEDNVPEAVAQFHKRLKKMYCPKGVVEYGGDLFANTKEGCERAKYARMFCYAKVDEVPAEE